MVGAFTLEHREGSFSDEKGTLHEHLACILAPILALKRENDLPLWQRGLAAARTRLRLSTGTASKPLIYGLIASFARLAFIALFPSTYSVSAPARLEAAFQRVHPLPQMAF